MYCRSRPDAIDASACDSDAHRLSAVRCTEGDPKFTNMFVKNLPDSVNEAKLRELCEAHGEVSVAP